MDEGLPRYLSCSVWGEPPVAAATRLTWCIAITWGLMDMMSRYVLSLVQPSRCIAEGRGWLHETTSPLR